MTRNVDESEQAGEQRWMRRAIELARKAEAEGEVPVGAVLVCGDREVASGYNRPLSRHDPTAHAEMEALRAAAAALGNYRLEDCDLVVTLEPCVMCAGAIVHARLRRLMFGARDLRFGGVRSKFRLADSELLNHRVEVVEGVLAAECTALLEDFFRARR
jgi:tRNA(adenine34) deaminase